MLVDFSLLLLFNLDLVLDEGDAKDFDDRWEVAQCLCQPESV